MVKEISFQDINLSVSQVTNAMGYKEHIPSSEILSKIRLLINEAVSKCNPTYSYYIYDGCCGKSFLHCDKLIFDTGKIITHSLKGSERFAVFVASAGTLFQQWLEELEQSSDIVNHYIADCIGSEIAEATADFMQNQLENECREKGFAISNRYSPGYCGWDVKEQHKLFSLLGNDTCGITLKESGLMYPIKSVSGVIGIGKEIKRKEYGCKQCNYKHCYKRKE